jgi:hypothetical protein
MPFPQRRPFVPRFLHPILPEIALAGSNQRLDLLRRAPLGDGDQGDLFRLAPRALAGIGNAGANLGEA